MRQVITSVLLVILVIGLIGVSFTLNQVNQEEKRLRSDLQYRSTLFAVSLREAIEPNFINRSEVYLKSVVERFTTTERFAGVSIYDNKGTIIVSSYDPSISIPQIQQIVTDVMDSDKANGDFVRLDDRKMYVFAVPLRDDTSVVGALMILQNAGYIDTQLVQIWRSDMIKFFIQATLLALVSLLILRWLIYTPVRSMVESIKATRTNGGTSSTIKLPTSPLLQPLVREVTNIQKSLYEARLTAREEARMRQEKLDSPWTEHRLQEFVKSTLKGRSLTVVSNREPYIHEKHNGKTRYFFPASGMVTAIEPIMQACGGTWIAHGSGSGDRLVVDKNDSVLVPPDDPKYSLRRVWLTEEEEQGYYYGFSNEGLWPLCHIAHARPTFREDDWAMYQKVNGMFAEIILKQIKNQHKPILLIQDYHFTLLPKMIKKSRPDAVIGLYWHIPWPSWESFSICPYRKEILAGMLGADLLGFHTQLHCNNFIETVGHELEALVDLEQFAVIKQSHTTFVKPFPISIAFYENDRKYQPNTGEERKQVLEELGIEARYLGVGIDRLDYTKGIIERMRAIEAFLQKYPAYRKKFVFIQISAPSRSKIQMYKDFDRDVTLEVERINSKFAENNWKPIVLLKRHHDREEIRKFYRAANLCLITSLHDGMNLVAKEFVAARSDEQGVLILSQFAGASRELRDALIVNPYDVEHVGDTIKTALEMPGTEQSKRMKKLRSTVDNYNVFRWSAELLKTLTGIS